MSKTHEQFRNQGYFPDQRQFFDRLITQDWETYIDPHWDRARLFEVRNIMSLIEDRCESVLDVGCGCGYHDLLFAGFPGIRKIVGIDYSEKSIQQANRHYPHEKIQRIVADIFEPSLALQSLGLFDLVVSFSVIEHLQTPVEFLQQCNTFVKPGGFMAVVTPNRNRVSNRLRHLCGKPPKYVDPLHFREYTIKELVQMGRDLNMIPLKLFGSCLQIQLNCYLFRISLLSGKTEIAMKLGNVFPHFANFIGVLFQQQDQRRPSGNENL